METNHFSFWGLIKHCRNLIRTGPFTQGRISRGEYLLSYLIVSLLGSTAGTVLWHLAGETGSMIASIIGVVLGVFGIKLIIKRSHDLGKNGRYYFVPLFILIALLAIAGVYAFTQGLVSFSEGSPSISGSQSIVLWIFGLALATAATWFLIRVIMIIFKSGTKGENFYGADALVHQPAGNGVYRAVGLCLLVVSIIIGSFGEPRPTNYDFNSPNMQGSDADSVVNTPSTSNTTLPAADDYGDTSASDTVSPDIQEPSLEDTPTE